MGYYEEFEKAETEARMRICPVCGKRFLPAPEHAYKIYISPNKDTGGTQGAIRRVCSYSCMRKHEKQYGERKHIKHGQMG